MAQQSERLLAVVEPVVTAAGYDLEGATLSAAGRRSLIRVVVDADGGINLDEVAALSRKISDAIDVAEVAGEPITKGAYHLEVTSPGVDRPLTLPRHWRRNIGRLVKVRVGEEQLTGRIRAADESKVTLELADETRIVPLDQLGAGRVEVEFVKLKDGLPGEEGKEEA